DLHLRSRKVWELLLQGNVIVPTRHDRDAGRARADRQLAIPPTNVTTDAGQTLSATGISEAAHAANDRFLEGHAVVPSIATRATLRRLERLAEADAGIAHRDHDDAPAESLLPTVGLHGHPTAASGVLDNVLTRFAQRHREAHRRLGVDVELFDENRLRLLLDSPNDVVHVVTLGDGRDLEQHLGLGAGARAGNGSMQLERVFGELEESGARPVRAGVVGLRDVQRGTLGARLGEGEERRKAVR